MFGEESVVEVENCQLFHPDEKIEKDVMFEKISRFTAPKKKCR